MTNLTLAEAGLLNQNPLVAGVIEAIVTTNQIYRALPFSFIEGNAMSLQPRTLAGRLADHRRRLRRFCQRDHREGSDQGDASHREAGPDHR
jgi:hypothetical protein